jgi:hypothetical protein
VSRGWWSLSEKAREAERGGSLRETKDGLVSLEGGWSNAESQFLKKMRFEIGGLSLILTPLSAF